VARSCVFCGGTPVSQEHVFPDWLAQFFTDDVVDFEALVQDADAAEQRRPWKGRPFSAKVGGPCEGCNNGWMSDLEAQAAPLLKPLVQGGEVTLAPSAQLLLATWAVKTMLMAVLVTANDARDWLADAYHWLVEHRNPPPAEQVWAARYAGEGQWPATLHFYAVCLAHEGETPPPRPNAHSASFAVGHLAFGLAGHTLKDGPVAVQRVASDSVRTLWPTFGESLELPPPATLAGDDEIRALGLPLEWRAP
jgi:hypothetical protein